MKFSIVKGGRSTKLRKVKERLEKLCPPLDASWKGVLGLEYDRAQMPTLIIVSLKLYDTQDAGAKLANDDEPEEMSDSGWDMEFGNRPPEFIAGWLAAELWKYWNDNG